MKLIFKQRIFSWFDSYDIYDESGNTVYTVKGQLSWGHKFCVYDRDGRHLATVEEKIFRFLPSFRIYKGDDYAGCINKKFTFFKPAFDIEYNGWRIDGDWFEWDYSILNSSDEVIATVQKEIFNFSDTYSIDIKNSQDALDAVLLVITIDAEKCSRD